MPRRDDDVPDDDFEDEDERPRRRRRTRDDFDEARPKSGGITTAVIVVIVVGILGFMTLACGGVLIGLLLPAVQKVREASARLQSQNNMKIVALGMFNYDSANNRFPGPTSQTNGVPNPGLSFRVDLLPYLEQANVYKQLDLTQPWDSVKNKPLTDTPVKDFLDLGNPASTGNLTPFRLFVGPGAIYDGSNKPVRPQDITDGTSNTILFVSATQTVPWAKPDELPYGPNVPLPALGSSPSAGGFNAAMADGSVRFIKRPIPDADLRSLIEKADGRVVIIP